MVSSPIYLMIGTAALTLEHKLFVDDQILFATQPVLPCTSRLSLQLQGAETHHFLKPFPISTVVIRKGGLEYERIPI